jgi:hypothetical protein
MLLCRQMFFSSDALKDMETKPAGEKKTCRDRNACDFVEIVKAAK